MGLLWRGGQRRLAAELLARSERRREAETEALLDGVKLAFADIALDSLRRLSEQLAGGLRGTLAAERRLDEQRLAAERVETLARETGRLARVLGQSRLRGQWGERLAEDLLRAAGLVEGVSWVRQRALDSGRRPDITFLLPDGARLHLDVKFPFERWLAAQDAPSEAERRRLEEAFLADVRAAIAEVERRAYADPASGTLDLALLFVPNEALAASLWSLAPGLLEEAMARRVLLVSPASLLAVLAVVRRAIEAFRLEGALRTLAAEAQGLAAARAELGAELERLGRRLEEAVRTFRAVLAIRQDRLDPRLDRLLGATAAGPDGAGGSAG